MSSITLNATKIAYVSQYYSNRNFNNPENLFVGLFEQPNSIYESFLMFDLSSIPTNATINSATLKLYVNKLTDTKITNQYISVISNLASFDETTISWDNQPMNNNIPDRQIMVNSSNVGSYVTTDLTQLVQQWFATPSNNHGLSLMGQIDKNAVIVISGNSNSAQAPELVVEYMQSNITIGTNENKPFTAAGTIESTAITSNNAPVSFQVATTVANATTTVSYAIQVSNDATNWYDAMDSYITSATIPATGTKYMLITNVLAKEYRVQMVVGGTVAATGNSFDITAITPAN